MKDFLQNEIKIGDCVVTARYRGLIFGRVVDMMGDETLSIEVELEDETIVLNINTFHTVIVPPQDAAQYILMGEKPCETT